MKNILVVPESKLNSGKIINLDKICVIYKLDSPNQKAISFVFDDDENQENWMFSDSADRDKMYSQVLRKVTENAVSVI